MKKFYLSTLVLLMLLGNRCIAQDFSNKGKEFWLAYSYHVGMVNGGGSPVMTLYLTCDVSTNFTVEIYGGPVIMTGTISANQVIPVVIPNTYFIDADGIFNGRAIHVTAVKPIVVYSFITRSQASAASLCLPTNVLGREYYASSFLNNSNEQNPCSYITLVGVEDNTSVEITVTATTRGGWAAGSTNTITLNKGQVYQVLGTTSGTNGVDLSGSRIRSVSSGNGCKKVAAFSGSGKLYIQAGGCTASSADNLYQQLYPLASWGKKYLTVPSYARPNNYYRIYRSNPATNVFLNGTLIPPGSFVNNYYQFYNNTPNYIDADEPISVAQYFTTQGCPPGGAPIGNPNPYDPEMILLTPIEQTIKNVTLVNTPLTVGQNPPNQPHQHHIHVIMKNAGTAISSFRFDGNIPAGSWQVHPQNSNYSYLFLNNVTVGNHSLVSDSGFNALAYGYGSAETYGYSAGANIRDLYTSLGFNTLYGNAASPSVCVGSGSKFKISLPYQPDSIFWQLSLLPGNPPDTMTRYPPSVPDSITVVNGRNIYWYSLPRYYVFNTVGTFPATLTVYSANGDGCGNEQDYEFEVEVFPAPIADFTFVTDGCVTNPVQFNDNSNTGGFSIFSRYWDFGDGNNSTANNPAHTYAVPNTYNVGYTIISDIGCKSDTTWHPITLNPPPVANFSSTGPYCDGNSISFTDLSNGSGGTINQWLWNFGDPGSGANNTSTLQNPTHVFSAPGTYTVTLTVTISTGCSSLAFTAQVTVNPLPTATISRSAAEACLNGPSPTVTFTGANGTAPYTFTYTINGGPNQIVTTTSGNSVSVSVPTNVAGTFVYALVGVQEGSPSACTQPQTGSVTVTILPLPTATISGSTSVCLNSTLPLITFTGSNGTAPYTFTYTINGGPNQIVTTTSGNSVTVSVPTNVAGTFIYALVGVQEGSPNGCSQPQTGSATVIVTPLPTATISGSVTVCLNAPQPDITFTGANGTAPYTFTYTINGGPNQIVTTTSGNSVTVSVPTNVAGTFVYALVGVQEGSGLACSQSQTGNATVIVNDLPTATISGSTTVCLNAPQPNITFTGANGIPPFTFTYTINGGPNQIVTTTSGNSVTIPVPTNVAGTFVYALVGVQEGSGNQCSQTQTGSATVIVKVLPTATIAASQPEVCLNGTSPTIIFTGANGTAPYTFTYTINGGPTQTVTTVSGNSVSVNVPTNVAGTFVYALVGVQEGGTPACSQSQTGSATVIVNPLPTANFNFSSPTCVTRVVNFTDISVPNAGAIVNWVWDFGDGSPNSNLQNPTHTYAAAGTYTVSLTVTTDKGCVSIVSTQQVTVNVLPVADFLDPESCVADTYTQFTDASTVPSGTIVGWLWDFGDPGSGPLNTSTLQNPQHSYSAVGVYNVTLTVTTNTGCTDVIIKPVTINGDLPVAGFTPLNPSTMCANDSIAIQNTSSVNFGAIVKVEIYWDNVGQPGVFDVDNSPAPGKIYKHLYPNSQTTINYTIRFRAYSGTACVDDSIGTITVFAAPLVQFNNMPDACLDAAPFQITQASEIGGVPGTGVFSGPGVTPGGIFNPAAVGPGTYRILYTFTSTAGGCVDTMSNLITVLQAPVADFSSGSPACETFALTFTDNSNTPVGALTTWTWDFGDGTPIVIRNNNSPFPHTFAAYGTYTVTLRVTTDRGCNSVVKSIPVTINPLPRASFAPPPVSCLPNANVTFTNLTTIPGGAALSYLWDFGDPGSGAANTSTLLNPSHTYTTVGPFTVNLQVTSINGCVKDTTIIVNNIHPQPTALFDVDKTDVCIGGSFTFTDLSSGADGTISQWTWTMGDGNIRTVPSFTYTYATPNRYDVTLQITNSWGCPSNIYTKTVYANPYPPANAGPDKVVLEGGTVQLTPAINIGIPVTYSWSPTQWLSNPNISNPNVVNPLNDITYTLTVTSDKGCSASDQVFVKLLKAPVIPNIFSPNGDGIHDKWVIEYLETYPGCTVEIYNRYGQLVFKSTGYSSPWDGTINGKPAPVGTYYYIVNPKNGRKIMSGFVDLIR